MTSGRSGMARDGGIDGILKQIEESARQRNAKIREVLHAVEVRLAEVEYPGEVWDDRLEFLADEEKLDSYTRRGKQLGWGWDDREERYALILRTVDCDERDAATETNREERIPVLDARVHLRAYAFDRVQAFLERMLREVEPVEVR